MPQRTDWDLVSVDSRGGGSDRYSQQTTARDPKPGDGQCVPASVSEELRTEPCCLAPLGKCTPGRPSGVGCAVLGSPRPPSQPCSSWCASRSWEQGLGTSQGVPALAPTLGYGTCLHASCVLAHSVWPWVCSHSRGLCGLGTRTGQMTGRVTLGGKASSRGSGSSSLRQVSEPEGGSV